MTWKDYLLALAGLLAAVKVIYDYFAGGVRFIDRQKKQDTELAELRQKHDEDIQAIKKEQTVLCYGVLACLKGLAEQGCDGPVHDAIDTLEKHLNVQAHS